MMRRMFWVALMLVLAFAISAVGIAGAQDSEPVDNLCDAGQAWGDGRCNIPGHDGASALAWECGFYMARVLDGRLSQSDLPTQCRHLLENGGVGGLCVSGYEEEGGYNWEYCFFSDQTGYYAEEYDGEWYTLELFRFISEDPDPSQGAVCPEIDGWFPSYGGPLDDWVWDEGYTEEELSSLGLLPFYCAYGNENS